MEKLLGKLKGDRVIWIVLILLSFFSLLVVYSATGALAFRKMNGNTFFYLAKQFIMLGLGFVVIAMVVKHVPVKYLSVFSPIMLVVSFILLVAALVLRVNDGGATGRTFNLGFISFQPAELVKISLVLFVSRILANNQDSENPPSLMTFMWILGITGVVCLTISLSNFSTAALLFVTIMVLMFIGRVPMRYLLLTMVGGIALIVAIYFLAGSLNIGRVNTVRGRIERFIHGDPSSDTGLTQADYAKMAIYHGGQTGKGPGGSKIRNHMAAAYNDFIFAIMVEEYGWLSFLVVLAYVVFAGRAGVIIRQCKRTFPAFIVAGLSLMFVMQAFINMGVSSGLFPVTGQTLPWVSLGGTSTLFTAFSLGCILRVSYQNTLEEEDARREDEYYEIPEEDHAFADMDY
ncbi:MAG TPA: FtsW/RodA/SpoVE family cell cycle protein [Prolixibacteraceae bacterium]|nr:FtsW/RodA/SpoVE family cell cycle protein [Prolixibacteraceae bacterium]HPS12815.1 FtsW/RodA/SpoVE family cell cycle protein [Prolixibacteraceae bacterium]